jgi:transcriptional regulator with XRE-family HTH domain
MELRKQREAAGLSNGQLAMRTEWSPSTISRIETGQLAIEPVDMIHYLGCCGLRRLRILDLIEPFRQAEYKLGHWIRPLGKWLEDSLSSLIYYESTADWSTIYQPQLVHGLLQTADYARARMRAERWRSLEDVDQHVRHRMDRQRILRVPRSASFMFFLHENALRAEVGGAAIMHEQLLQIVFATALTHVTVRVVRSSDVDALAFGGPFHLLEYRQCPSLVYLDNQSSGLFLEDWDYVEPYRDLVPAIADVALDGGESREFIAALADEYDRGSAQDAGHRVEEEQF